MREKRRGRVTRQGAQHPPSPHAQKSAQPPFVFHHTFPSLGSLTSTLLPHLSRLNDCITFHHFPRAMSLSSLPSRLSPIPRARHIVLRWFSLRHSTTSGPWKAQNCLVLRINLGDPQSGNRLPLHHFRSYWLRSLTISPSPNYVADQSDSPALLLVEGIARGLWCRHEAEECGGEGMRFFPNTTHRHGFSRYCTNRQIQVKQKHVYMRQTSTRIR
ncbi:hypothetical protein E2C01_091421 [Portunus trituberculatus]|uniref:Uncharacterized protein n=1 Tax=Portunus trituberculatus TaxID=210409 RepID=A0A5B7JMX0_PORTR|nr:hypothetical protein [Portunus trituberculatus]